MCVRGDGGAAVIVFAAREDIGSLGRGEFAHDHDFLGGVGEGGLGGARGGEGGEGGPVGLVVGGEVGVVIGR